MNCKKWFLEKRKLKQEKSFIYETLEIKILLDHLDGISYRRLENRYGIPKKRLCQMANEQIANLIKNIEITKYFWKQLKYCGNHVVDGKYVPVKKDINIGINLLPTNKKGKIPKSRKRIKVIHGKVCIWGIDYGSHDILHYEFDFSESGAAFDSYFRTLKSIDYEMKSLTFDDRKSEIMNSAKRYYPDCIFQLCTRHYSEKVNRELAIRSVKIRIKSLENKIEKLFDGDTSEFIPDSRPWSTKRACRLANEIADLEFRHELLLDFQIAISSILNAESLEVANYRIVSLEKYFWPRRWKMRKQFPIEHINKVKKLISDFKSNKNYLLNYLKYPHLNIPSTTNIVEGLNSQLESRINSIKGFESSRTADNYINAWILKRRFAKFTDCRGNFKKFNGKAPLECAGADISNIRSWIEFCLNLSKFSNKNDG